MHPQVAILVHSWFSWVTARAIASCLDPIGEKTLYILSRGFDPGSELSGGSWTLRFEEIESIYNSQLSNNLAEKSALDHLNNERELKNVSELILPHIFYYPFARIAEEECFKSVSFYQESLQCPPGTLCQREALLLKSNNNSQSLFTTDRKLLQKKLTNKYYNLNEQYVPLHLKSIVISETIEALETYLPKIDKSTQATYDYAIIAGKSMNCAEGIRLIDSIIECIIQHQSKSTILFKASPSSSRDVHTYAQSLTKRYAQVAYMNGTDSLEQCILEGRIRTLITEMFSLATMFNLKYPDKKRIVSIEATIIRDFPSLATVLTERMDIKNFRKYALSFQSLSQHILNQLAKTC